MNKDGYDLYKCSNCELVYMNPLPLQTFLNKEVYSLESGYQGNKENDLSKTFPNKKTKDILKFLGKNKIKGRILDVGCSNGEFLYHAKKRGFEAYGVELNSRTASIALKNGLNVFKGLLHEARFENDFFDIIFLGDIIEHVLSPRDFLHECKRILKNSGTIIISTPNLDCAWAKTTIFFYKTLGIPCSSVTPPHHTFQFSGKNLDMLMMQTGFIYTNKWFYKQPRLMYELGSLHLLKKYKANKNIKNLVFMIFSFILYTLSYFAVASTRSFRRKDFGMLSIYKK